MDRDDIDPPVTVQRILNASGTGRFQDLELEYPAMIDVRRFTPESPRPLASLPLDAAGEQREQPTDLPEEELQIAV